MRNEYLKMKLFVPWYFLLGLILRMQKNEENCILETYNWLDYSCPFLPMYNSLNHTYVFCICHKLSDLVTHPNIDTEWLQMKHYIILTQNRLQLVMSSNILQYNSQQAEFLHMKLCVFPATYVRTLFNLCKCDTDICSLIIFTVA